MFGALQDVCVAVVVVGQVHPAAEMRPGTSLPHLPNARLATCNPGKTPRLPQVVTIETKHIRNGLMSSLELLFSTVSRTIKSKWAHFFHTQADSGSQCRGAHQHATMRTTTQTVIMCVSVVTSRASVTGV